MADPFLPPGRLPPPSIWDNLSRVQRARLRGLENALADELDRQEYARIPRRRTEPQATTATPGTVPQEYRPRPTVRPPELRESGPVTRPGLDWQPPEPTTAGVLGRGVAQGATLFWGEEAAAEIAQKLNPSLTREEALRRTRLIQQGDFQARPGTALIGELAGSVIPEAAAVMAGVRPLTAAAALGGVAGAGMGETPGQRLGYGAAGAVAGPLLGAAGEAALRSAPVREGLGRFRAALAGPRRPGEAQAAVRMYQNSVERLGPDHPTTVKLGQEMERVMARRQPAPPGGLGYSQPTTPQGTPAPARSAGAVPSQVDEVIDVDPVDVWTVETPEEIAMRRPWEVPSDEVRQMDEVAREAGLRSFLDPDRPPDPIGLNRPEPALYAAEPRLRVGREDLFVPGGALGGAALGATTIEEDDPLEVKLAKILAGGATGGFMGATLPGMGRGGFAAGLGPQTRSGRGGQPMGPLRRLYHGTGQTFDRFDPDMADPISSIGTWFSKRPELADEYTGAQMIPWDDGRWVNEQGQVRLAQQANTQLRPQVVPATAAIGKPFRIDQEYRLDELPEQLQVLVDPKALDGPDDTIRGGELMRVDSQILKDPSISREELTQAFLDAGFDALESEDAISVLRPERIHSAITGESMGPAGAAVPELFGPLAGAAAGALAQEEDDSPEARIGKILLFAIAGGAATQAGRIGRGGFAAGPAGRPRDTRIHGLLDGSEALDLPEGRVTIREVGHAMERRAMAAYGRTLDLDADREQIVDQLVAEAKLAEADATNAADWYRQKLEEAFEIAAERYPELRTDPVAREAFRAALAITSNGIKVADNAKYADQIYQAYKDTGRFPVEGWGAQSKGMRSGFRTLNDLMERLGPETTFSLLDTELPVRTMKQMGLKTGEELTGETLPASVILGPKIGGGFYRNLGGFFDEVTMDRWFRRTVGRITGDMIEKPTKEGRRKARLRLLDNLQKEDYRPEGLTKAELRRDPELLLQAARRANTRWESIYRAAPEGAKPKFKPAWAKAAKNYIENFDPSVREAPKSGSERQQLRRIIRDVQEQLRTEGRDYDAASIQAMLWYPERRLYEQLGVKIDARDMDYAKALAELYGVDENEADRIAGLAAERIAAEGPERLAGREGTVHRAGLGGRDLQRVQSQLATDRLRARIEPARSGADGFASGHVTGRSRGDGSPVLNPDGSRSLSFGKAYTNAFPTLGISGMDKGLLLLPSDRAGAERFASAIQEAKAADPEGMWSVDAYEPEGYEGLTLIITPDNKAGVAIRDGEIVSLFKHPEARLGRSSHPLLMAAIQAGGTHMDAFDIGLTEIYTSMGFRPVARMRFNADYAPDGWSPDDPSVAKYNQGHPDVIGWRYDPAPAQPVRRNEAWVSEGGEYVEDYDEMVSRARGTPEGPPSP